MAGFAWDGNFGRPLLWDQDADLSHVSQKKPEAGLKLVCRQKAPQGKIGMIGNVQNTIPNDPNGQKLVTIKNI